MFSSCRDYFQQMVVPTYRAFFRARAQNRYGECQLVAKGVDVATVLFHLREHVPRSTRPSRTQLQNQYQDYGLVADIANASKHKVLTQANPRVSNASQISEIMVVTEYRDEQGNYTSAQVEVRVMLDDGTEDDLARLLHSVFGMWCTELKLLGVGDFHNPQDAWSDSHLSRSDAKEAPIEQLAGEARKLSFQFREFDYDAGVSKPKDLTSKNFSLNVYKYPETVPITLRSNDDPSLEVEIDVPLPQDQAEQYVRLSDPGEQHAFLAGLIETDETLQVRVRDALIGAGAMPASQIAKQPNRLRRAWPALRHWVQHRLRR